MEAAPSLSLSAAVCARLLPSQSWPDRRGDEGRSMSSMACGQSRPSAMRAFREYLRAANLTIDRLLLTRLLLPAIVAPTASSLASSRASSPPSTSSSQRRSIAATPLPRYSRPSIIPFAHGLASLTLNEAKLNAHVRDLADPAVALSTLSNSIPHGFRGKRILEVRWLGFNPSASAGAGQTAVPPSSSTPLSPTDASYLRSVDISRALRLAQCVEPAI